MPENRANDQIAKLAKAAPRGQYPRAFLGEQPYWTLAGSDGGAITALISEDAAIEPAKGSYSIEPVVIDGGKQFTWADVAQRQSLVDGRLPIPSVHWTAPSFTLDTTLLADSAGRAAFAAYRLTNRGAARTLELRLGVKGWQVTRRAIPAQKAARAAFSAMSRQAMNSGRPATDEGDQPSRGASLDRPRPRGASFTLNP